jgi:hypothetical protein
VIQDKTNLHPDKFKIQATAGVCHERRFSRSACLSFDGKRITVYLFICILFHHLRLGLTIHCAGQVTSTVMSAWEWE